MNTRLGVTRLRRGFQVEDIRCSCANSVPVNIGVNVQGGTLVQVALPPMVPVMDLPLMVPVMVLAPVVALLRRCSDVFMAFPPA